MKIINICQYYMDNWSYQENFLPENQACLDNDVIVVATDTFPDFINTKYEGSYNYKLGNVKIKRVHIINNRWKFKFVNLNTILEEEKPDLIFVHGFHLLRDKQILNYKINNPECIVNLDIHADHNNSGFYNKKIRRKLSYYFWYHIFYRNIVKKALPFINKIFYVSPTCEVFAREMLNVPKDRLYPLYLGTNLTEIKFDKKSYFKNSIHKKYNIPEESLIIMTAGKIDSLKNLDKLVKAFINLKLGDVHLLIVGSVDECYNDLFEKYVNGNDKIHLTGWIQSNQLNEYFLASDLGVFLGGQSVLWQQAISCGLVTIFRYFPGIEYLNNDSSLFVYSDNIDELTQILDLILNNGKLIEYMSKNAIQNGSILFNYIEIAKKSIGQDMNLD